MRPKWILSALIVLIFVTIFTEMLRADVTADFYVSPSGRDSWSGKLSEPLADGSDGPFRTLTRARDEVRKSILQMRSDIVVMIKDGTYYLDKTIHFSTADSGRNGFRVIYRNYPDEYPVFSSGIRIANWEQYKDTEGRLPNEASGRVWVTDIPDGVGRFYTLYKGSQRLPRARSKGFTPVLGPKDPQKSKDALHYPPGTIFRNWSNIEDIEIVIRPFCLWTMNILPLRSVDEEKMIAYTSLEGSYPLTTERHNRFGPESVWIENVFEALDQPGEWVLNSIEQKLYYWPKEGTPGDNVIIPKLKEFIRVEGDEQSDKPVSNIVFKGFMLTHGERDTWNADDKGLQHDWEMYDKANAMMRFRWAENCEVSECIFTNSGGTGLRLDLFCQNIDIRNNEFSYLGGTGIVLAGYGPGIKDFNRKNKIVNNHIHDIGQIYWHNAGILMWQTGENLVAQNLIYNTPYNGISVGGVFPKAFSEDWFGLRELTRTINWEECGLEPGDYDWNVILPFIHTRFNVFEYNEIHNTVQLMGDGNGFYIRMCPPGNIFRRNYVHHILGKFSAGAVRADDDQFGCEFKENVIYNCVRAGFVIKKANSVENNIIADIIAKDNVLDQTMGIEGYILLVPASADPGGAWPLSQARITRNIFIHTGDNKPIFYSDTRHWPQKQVYIENSFVDFNVLYWQGKSQELKNLFSSYRMLGIDKNSQAVNPKCKNVNEGDFTLSPDSPAFKLGIKPIDVVGIGLTEYFPERLKKRF